jgi:hypothetical protein
MRVGVVKEIKTKEARVGLTPAGAAVLVADGHEVRVEQGAPILPPDSRHRPLQPEKALSEAHGTCAILHSCVHLLAVTNQIL